MDRYYKADLCDLKEFKSLLVRELTSVEVPNAAAIEKNIPVYHVPFLAEKLSESDSRREIMSEWASILLKGAGVFVLKQAQPNHVVIDETTAIYKQIIDQEKVNKTADADHFAEAGNNDRIWNSLQKLCSTAPKTFIEYFSSPAIDAAAEAWLGPNYQMTAQINLVRPGGKAQQPHRDYHLGFQPDEVSATYPVHVHDLSPQLTLQGGIAHCDMTTESGPTQLLPFSQLYRQGYMAWRRDDFRAYFEEHFVQLPLQKGDSIFFNPALFHAAGENRSANSDRMVNLLQISTAFGRAMESIDREGMCRMLYAPLCEAWNSEQLSEVELDAVIASSAEGYSFPTNLDKDPPVDGLAPETQAALLKRAVVGKMPEHRFTALLIQQTERKRA